VVGGQAHAAPPPNWTDLGQARKVAVEIVAVEDVGLFVAAPVSTAPDAVVAAV